MIEFYVPGIPRPKGSTRAFVSKTTRRLVVKSDCSGLKQWEHAVRTMARRYRPRTEWLGPVSIEVTFYLPKPKTVARLRPAVRPDIDKLVRGAVDGLSGVIFKDDAQIVRLDAQKLYCNTVRSEPGAAISIAEVEP